MISLGAVNGPWHFALEKQLFDTGHDGADGTAFFEPLLEVARLVQFFIQPGLFEGDGVIA